MAQGKALLGRKKKSAGAQLKKKKQKAATKKGWKTCTTTKQRKLQLAKEDQAVSKSINAKNEAVMASRALQNHGTIVLGDLKKVGKEELSKQKQAMLKKTDTTKKYVERAKKELAKLNGGR
mmetsp:Transcript_26669/g.39548  ORF Transcript_26669/g.39548 Transcript_26669/m.39548 type:complete len:121 (-) Transcript_26669:376-738(-)